MDTCKVLVAGDVNFRMDNESNNDTKRFLDLLNAGYLTQNLEGRTHDAEHTVNLLTTRSSDAFRNNIGIDIPHMSDHSAIQRTLRLANPPNVQVTMKSRSYKLISTSAICEDIRSLHIITKVLDVSWNEDGEQTDRSVTGSLIQGQLVTSSIHRAQLEYHMSKITHANVDQKKLFKIVANLIHVDDDTPLLPCDLFNTLAEQFSGLLLGIKISKIQSELIQ